MEKNIVGRTEEIKVLGETLLSQEAEMVAIFGRRRIGKTFLISTVYEKEIVFELSGTQGGSLKQQLKNFRDELSIQYKTPFPMEIPEDWLGAFQILKQYLISLESPEKKVIFFDEVPWLAGHKSGFLEAMGYFWNSWASRQNIVLVICGSAASWMIRRIVHDKGGLHNRITKRIHLQPFTLSETENFLQSRGVFFDRFQLLHLYMAMGGVPQYLKEVKPNLSAIQNIDKICFANGGLLQDEFSKLYGALFSNADRHIAIIRALAQKWKGMDRDEILQKTKLDSGGGTTTLLEELEQSGFIMSYQPFGKKQRDKIYRLTDSYSLFYLQFIENNSNEEGIWLQLSQSQKFKSWSGYAFENLCLAHLSQIKKALGISGIFTSSSIFYKKQTADLGGTQIDLVLDRKDHVINLFEMKFYEEEFIPTKNFADNLREKRLIFKTYTNTKKQISWVMLSAYGIKPNQHSVGLVNHVLTMDDLFEK
jgi:uncharacterized protein